jgi:long-chain fatty acid transport protein
MKIEMRGMTGLVSGLILAGSVLPVWATGFRLPDQDAFATARGEAFVATADNPSAIYYNPAGITQLEGQNLRGGVYGIFSDVTYTSPLGNTYKNREDLHAVPQFFYTWTLDSLPLAFGLGLYSPYGLSSRWDQDTGFRTIATQGNITSYTIDPTVAWRILPNLSLGAGLKVNYADIDLRQGLVWPNQPFDQFRFRGNNWAVGYDVGLLWKPVEQLALGAAFRSTTSFDFKGQTEYYNNIAFPPGVGTVPAFPMQRVDSSANFDLPLDVVFGVSYRPNTNWNFEFDADYTGWNCLGTVTIAQQRGFPGLLPQNVPLVLDWEPSWYFEFGATRYLGKGWSVSAGYIYNQNSVPNDHYTPLVADLDRHFFSLGTGYRGEHFSFDVAYQFGIGPTHTVTGSAPSMIGQTANGDYKYLSNAVMVSVGYHF